MARMFVARHKEYIQQELEKQRTVISIWKELQSTSSEQIPYRSFLYNVSNQITKNIPTRLYTEKDAEQRESGKKSPGISSNFNFSTQIDSKDII